MNITVEDAGSCQKTIKVEVPVEHIRKKMNENFRQLSQQVQLPGFRPGKAPRPLLEKKYGKYIADDLRQQLLEESIEEATKEHDLQLLERPEIEVVPEVKKDEALNFTMTVEVRPEFELPTYKGLEISTSELTVSDEERDIFMRNVQFSQGELKELADGETSKEGDVLFGDFRILSGTDEVASRPEGSIEIGNDIILGIKVPGASKEFVGLAGATEKECRFEATTPDDFPFQEHAGKKVAIEVHIKDIRRPDAPALDEELAKQMGFDSFEAMQEHGREVILDEKKKQQQGDLSNRLMTMIVDQVKLEIPPKLAERQLSSMLQREAFQKYQQGMDDKAIEKFIEKRREELPESIERSLKTTFVIDAIAKKERVFVTEDEIGRQITQIAMQRQVDPQKLADMFVQQGMIPQIRSELRAAKVNKLLRDKAKISFTGGDGSAKKSDDKPAKKDEAKKSDAKKDEPKKAESKSDDGAKKKASKKKASKKK